MTCSIQALQPAGLEASPGGLLQDQFVQRQVRDRPEQPAVLRLELLQALNLLVSPTVLLTPPVIGGLAYADLADDISYVLPCDMSTSACRSSATISSGLCFFFGTYRSSWMSKDIVQVGPLFWGCINASSVG